MICAAISFDAEQLANAIVYLLHSIGGTRKLAAITLSASGFLGNLRVKRQPATVQDNPCKSP